MIADVSELEHLRERVRAFVDEHVVPAEADLDAGLDPVRRELSDRARADGLWALPLPREYGGQGLALADYLALAEGEGRSDHGPDVLGSGSLLNARTLLAHASPALREKILPGLVAGETRLSYAMTEPGVAGSDPTGIRTTAVPLAGGGFEVTGHKWFTTGADRAGLVLVFARVADRADRFTVVAVPVASDGFEVVREIDVLGAGGQHELRLDRVRVGSEHVLGEPGNGLRIAGERLALGRTLRALRWVGQAQRALEMYAGRATTRAIGDGVLADRQLVQGQFFEAELRVRSARLLAADAARRVAAGERAPVEVSMAKVASARAAWAAVDAAIQVHGAEGLTAASGLPRLLRWARAARILDGADELHVSSAASRLMRDYAG